MAWSPKAALSGAAFSFCLLLVAGCAGTGADERRDEALGLGRAAGFTAQRFTSGPFEIFALLRLQPNAQTVRVYIEGDGAPWPGPYSPPADPTPAPDVVLPMAIADVTGSVVYFARPCQFVRNGACDVRFWTSHRFAPEIVAAYGDALDELKRRAGARRVRLIGYSGGGVVAALLARSREDVEELTTIAAPLDTAAWTALHGLTPLVGENPVAAPGRLATLRQRHWAGGRDNVVPPALVRSFAARLGQPAAAVEAKGYDHVCCWARDWRPDRQGFGTAPEGGTR